MARKKYNLGNVNGNAYCIMGAVQMVMGQEREAMGWDDDTLEKEKKAYVDDAMSGDYNHLVAVSRKMVDRINKAVSGGNENGDEG